MLGRGVDPDDRHAYKWLTVAATRTDDQRLNKDLEALRTQLPSAQLREAHEAAERIFHDSSRLPPELLDACPLCQEPECLEHVYGDDSITDVAERETSRPSSRPVPAVVGMSN